jgi:hypothetical protein
MKGVENWLREHFYSWFFVLELVGLWMLAHIAFFKR